jgi:hypothetical protein
MGKNISLCAAKVFKIPPVNFAPTPVHCMNSQATFRNSLRHPSAFLPIGMSLVAVAVVLTHLVLAGTARQPDEGTAAHLWQLLMAGQLPIILFFAIRWLPTAPRQALAVLALQAASAVAALLPVYLLHW